MISTTVKPNHEISGFLELRSLGLGDGGGFYDMETMEKLQGHCTSKQGAGLRTGKNVCTGCDQK